VLHFALMRVHLWVKAAEGLYVVRSPNTSIHPFRYIFRVGGNSSSLLRLRDQKTEIITTVARNNANLENIRNNLEGRLVEDFRIALYQEVEPKLYKLVYRRICDFEKDS